MSRGPGSLKAVRHHHHQSLNESFSNSASSSSAFPSSGTALTMNSYFENGVDTYRTLELFRLLSQDVVPLGQPEVFGKQQQNNNDQASSAGKGKASSSSTTTNTNTTATTSATTPPLSLRSCAWRGIPEAVAPIVRPSVWLLLCDEMPNSSKRRSKDSQRKLKDYLEYVRTYYGTAPRGTTDSSTRLEGSSDVKVEERPETIPQELAILKQLELDLPRHKAALFHHPETLDRLRRCIFVWSLRHPAASYVQGMDDIIALFLMVFLQEEICHQGETHSVHHLDTSAWLAEAVQQHVDTHPTESNGAGGGDFTSPGRAAEAAWNSAVATPSRQLADSEASFASSSSLNNNHQLHNNRGDESTLRDIIERVVSKSKRPMCLSSTNDRSLFNAAISTLSAHQLDAAESRAYYCAGRLLSWVQHHYTYGQPGVTSAVSALESLLLQVDAAFHEYLTEDCHVKFISFAMPWIHLLFVRDLGAEVAARLFDTYLAIGERFVEFHIYVCCALLLSLKPKIMKTQATELVIPMLLSPMDSALNPTPSTPEEMMTLTQELAEGKRKKVLPSVPWLDTLVADAYLLQLKGQVIGQDVEK